jgi:O-antigen/teichoic acid export membrane protein
MKDKREGWVSGLASSDSLNRLGVFQRARAVLVDQFRLPLHRNGYALLFGSGTTSVLGLAYWVLAARLYPAETVGLNSALLAAMMFLSGLGQLGINSTLIRFIPRAGRASGRFILITYGLATGIAVLASLVFYFGAAWWAPALSFVAAGSIWRWSFLAAVIVWCLFALQDNVLTGLRQATWVPVENTLFSFVKILLLLIFVRSSPAFGILLSWVLPAVLLIPPVNLLIFGRMLGAHAANPPPGGESMASAHILRFGAGNFLGSLFFVVYSTLLPVMVTNQVSPSANAYFYLPWTVASSIQLIGLSLAASLVVESALDRSLLRAHARRVLVSSFALLLPTVLVIFVSAPYLLQVYGAAYAAAGTLLLRLLMVAAIPSNLVAVAIGIMRARNRNRQIVLSQGILCAIALGLSYILLPRAGITGVGAAWLVAQTVAALYLLLTEFAPLFRRQGPAAG